MGCVTRLGAKGPANVARFRGATASQRCRSKRSRAPTESSTQRSGRLGYLGREVGLDSGAADDLLELLQRDRVVTWLGSGLGSGLGLRLGQGLG
eukprot:scaffold9849_cov51-Phaeocystis_antarctica.AAC.2